MKYVREICAANKKLTVLFLGAVILLVGSAVYYIVSRTYPALITLLAAVVPFLAILSFLSWRGKEYLETYYAKETNGGDAFLDWLRYRLEHLWMRFGIVAGGVVLMWLWVFLQYRSGNLVGQ